MHVNNIAARQRDSNLLHKSGNLFGGHGSQVLAAVTSQAASTGRNNAALGKILSQYNVADITPQQFSELLQKLNEAGGLGKDDLRNLSQVRLDLNQAGVHPDDHVNLLDFYGQKLTDLRQGLAATNTSSADRATLQQSMVAVQSRVDWLQKLATLHAAPDAAGLNAQA